MDEVNDVTHSTRIACKETRSQLLVGPIVLMPSVICNWHMRILSVAEMMQDAVDPALSGPGGRKQSCRLEACRLAHGPRSHGSATTIQTSSRRWRLRGCPQWNGLSPEGAFGEHVSVQDHVQMHKATNLASACRGRHHQGWES